MPTVPIVPPRIAELDDEREYNRINLLILRNTALGNFFDRCSISLPCHRERRAAGRPDAGGRDAWAMRGCSRSPQRSRRRSRLRGDAALGEQQHLPRQFAVGIAQLVHDGEVVRAGDRDQRARCMRRGALRMQVRLSDTSGGSSAVP